MSSLPITDQPLPVPSDRPAIADLVIADLRERKRIGIERYGTPLQSFNDRYGLVDLYQELEDALLYARQEIEEKGALINWLETIHSLVQGRSSIETAQVLEIIAATLLALRGKVAPPDPQSIFGQTTTGGRHKPLPLVSIGKLYRHFKGDNYLMLGVASRNGQHFVLYVKPENYGPEFASDHLFYAIHTETEELWIVDVRDGECRPSLVAVGEKKIVFWLQPIESFCSLAELEGQQVQRFRLVAEPSSDSEVS